MSERQNLRSVHWLYLLVGCLLLLPLSTYLFASAESFDTPAITYDSAANLVTIGSETGTPPASQVVTIPELAAALASQGRAHLLVDQGGGSWLLKASLLIQTTARLEATNGTLQWLRLDSPPLQPVVITAYRGGHLLVNGIKVTSWDSTANTVDENTANQRSYLLALQGGRMDILNSDVGYLGWESGEASGLSWRERLVKESATTGATGRLEDSQIHHNYFGMYSFEAYGLTILRNKVFDNIYYGIDPHDYSEGFETAYNTVYNNGNHGIIFSRHCIKNNIHHNEVYNNNGHGIMLDRGTNQNKVYNNLIYNNKDGIAIFQSSDNELYDNIVRNNERGVRVNATFDTDDIYDGISTNNKFTNNTIEDSKEYGVYLYARADRNIFTGNTVLRSGVSGFYIKTGGNRLEGNVIRLGALGVSIVGGDVLNLPAQAAPALETPGDKNIVLDNTITNNNDTGLRILGASHNRIGSISAGEKGNRVEENGRDGIAIGDSSTGSPATNNQILGNSIKRNDRHGVLINDLTSIRNRVSQNSIAGNGWLGIKVATGAQGGIQPPVITSKPANGLITGTAQPNMTIEVYNDAAALQAQAEMAQAAQADESLLAPLTNAPYAEGAIYLGATTSNGSGAWSFQVSGSFNPDDLNALAIDQNGNTSAFSNGDVNSGGGGGTPTYTFGTDANNQRIILVNGVGATVTLADIQAGVSGDSPNHLLNLGNGSWQLNTSISIGAGVTLNLTPEDGVKELRLRSEKNSATLTPTPNYDYTSFVFLRTYNGSINIERIKLYSWDDAAQKVDEDYNNGRAYLLAKYVAVLNIRDAVISYLGSGDGESYGISWRDINETNSTVLRTRVTGDVVNSEIHHNYYGIYTFQASDMLFQGNKFHHNVRYGFDPHDFTHSVLVENNSAYNNGAHGFIISRGCNNFIIRNNKAYDNSDPGTSEAHGFMLDPGSPTSADPQAPSYDNVLENNEAYNNEGFGLRILGSINNQVMNNYFHHNQVGVSVDDKSTGNLIQNNRLEQNREHGLILLENANNNTVLGNQIIGNSSHGLYLRSNNNLVRNNTIQLNRMDGVYVWTAVGNSIVQNNQIISNTIIGNLDRGLDLRKARQTLLQENVIADHTNHGIYLSDGSFQNSILRNIIRNNGQQGIRAVGAPTYANTWSQNQIYSNKLGGVLLSQSANGNLTAPIITTVIEQTMTGNAPAGATVEIFADNVNQGQFYVGQAIAGADGAFTFTAVAPWPDASLSVIAIDTLGNATAFSTAVPSAGYRGGTNPSTPVAGTATSTPVTPISVTVTPGTPAPETPTPVPGSDKVHLPLIRK